MITLNSFSRFMNISDNIRYLPKLDYNSISQLIRCFKDDASALGAIGLGFNSRLQQGFLCLICFCFVVVVFLVNCPNTHCLSQHLAFF